MAEPTPSFDTTAPKSATEPSIQDPRGGRSHDIEPGQAVPNTEAGPSAPTAIGATEATAAGQSSSSTPEPATRAGRSSASVTGGIEVTVNADRPGSAEDGYRSRYGQVGAFGELLLRDVPYSVNVTPAAAWENRNAHTEQDVLLTNPTVGNLMAPLAPGGGGMSRTMVRGSTMGDQGVLRDGLIDRGFTYPWFENVERVEVMNGLTSLVNGFGTMGGTVNYVSKRPTSEPMGAVSFGNYGGGINYVTGDFSGRLPIGESKHWAFRSIVHKEGGNTFVQDSKERRTLLTSIVTYRPKPRVELSADIAYQNFFAQGLQNYIDVSPSNGIHVPSASILDPRRQYGQSWNFVESDKLLVGGSLKAPISEYVSVRAAYRYGTMWRRYNTAFGSFVDNVGSYDEVFVATPRQVEHTHAAYGCTDVRFATAQVKHVVTAGYSGTQFYYERGNDQRSPLGRSNVNAPLVVPAVPTWVTGSANAMRTAYDSLIVGERMTWRFLSLLGGLNYSQIRSVNWALSSNCTTAGQCPVGGRSDTTQGAFTPSIGVTLRPSEAVSLYGSYIEGLQPGGTAPASAQNAFEAMSPSHSRQIEVGLKSEISRLQLTVALFRIDQINELLDPADNNYKQDGRQVNHGVEALTAGRLGYGFSVIGGFTYMRDRVTRAHNNTALEGKVPVNVPEQNVRVFLDYLMPFARGLAVNVGANYNGKRFADNLNTESTDSYVTFDAGLRYGREFSRHRLDASLHLENLADARYWAYYRSGSGLLAGAPRTLSLSAKVGLW